MNLLRELRQEIFRMFGLEGNESPRVFLDGVFGALGAFALIVLMAIMLDKNPWIDHRRGIFIAGTMLLASIALSKHRAAVLMGMLAIVGFRGLIAALLYGYRLGVAFAVLAVLAFYVGWRYQGGAELGRGAGSRHDKS